MGSRDEREREDIYYSDAIVHLGAKCVKNSLFTTSLQHSMNIQNVIILLSVQ